MGNISSTLSHCCRSVYVVEKTKQAKDTVTNTQNNLSIRCTYCQFHFIISIKINEKPYVIIFENYFKILLRMHQIDKRNSVNSNECDSLRCCFIRTWLKMLRKLSHAISTTNPCIVCFGVSINIFVSIWLGFELSMQLKRFSW